MGDEGDVLGREAHLSRLGEIAWAMADAGIVLVAALSDVGRFDLARLRALAMPHELFIVDQGSDTGADLQLPADLPASGAVNEVLRALTEASVLR
jgi:hypothetical protein